MPRMKRKGSKLYMTVLAKNAKEAMRIANTRQPSFIAEDVYEEGRLIKPYRVIMRPRKRKKR